MSRFCAKLHCGAGLAMILLTSQALGQSTLYVDDNATGANNGSSWCNAFSFLQDALSAVADSGGNVTEIRVAGGVYQPDRGVGHTGGNRLATFRLIRGVALRGGYAGCGAGAPDLRDFVANESVLNGDLVGNDLPGFVNRAVNDHGGMTLINCEFRDNFGASRCKPAASGGARNTLPFRMLDVTC